MFLLEEKLQVFFLIEPVWPNTEYITTKSFSILKLSPKNSKYHWNESTINCYPLMHHMLTVINIMKKETHMMKRKNGVIIDFNINFFWIQNIIINFPFSLSHSPWVYFSVCIWHLNRWNQQIFDLIQLCVWVCADHCDRLNIRLSSFYGPI